MHQQKVISKTSLKKMSKNGKHAFFRHVYANNSFLYIYKKNFFSGFEISVKFCVFFYTHVEFLKKFFFLAFISIFSKP